MYTLRKTLACLLVALMALSLLASASAEDGVKHISDMLPDGDKPVLRQLNINIATDYNEYPVTKVIEERTGYKVEYDMLPSSDPMGKLNLIIASQEPYDIVVTGGETNTVTAYAKAGQLVDIAPWLEYAPLLNAAINDYERETFTIDGHLYAIGMQAPAFGGKGGAVNNTLFVRQDYMDALGLSMPKTTDELKDVLRTLKDYTDSEITAAIPVTTKGSDVLFTNLRGAFGIPNTWNEADGELVNCAADIRMKDYLAYMKELYQEGLIDAEFPANLNTNVQEKFATGQAAMAYMSCYDYQNFGDSMLELEPEAVISYMPPLEGPNGDKAFGATEGGMDRIAFIPATCKNIEHVINFMELKLEPDTFRLLTIGEENVHYTVDENGERWPILPIFTQERGSSVNYYAGRPAELYAEYWTLRVKKRADIWDAWKAMNMDPSFTDYRVISSVGYAPAFDSGKYTASLNEMFTAQCVKIIAGTLDVDSYDDFIEEWLEAGGQELTDDYNAWWSEFNA